MIDPETIAKFENIDTRVLSEYFGPEQIKDIKKEILKQTKKFLEKLDDES